MTHLIPLIKKFIQLIISRVIPVNHHLFRGPV
jgi:hypothetical protein